MVVSTTNQHGFIFSNLVEGRESDSDKAEGEIKKQKDKGEETKKKLGVMKSTTSLLGKLGDG